MASLAPGILLKLLQNVDNKDFKVAGQHRSALLQVIGIVPSLAGDDDNPWKTRGFFLRVSDSMHSAYVSMSEQDLDLVLSDKIQLGQFIHVTRLDSGSPVPVLRGLNPVPKRRPCVGNPKDVISSDSLQIRTRVDFSTKKNDGASKRTEVKAKSKTKKLGSESEGKPRRLSLGNEKVEGLELRRLSLDSSRKGWDSTPRLKVGVSSVGRLKSKEGSSPSDTDSVLSSRKIILEKDSVLKCPSTNSSLHKHKIVPQKLKSKVLNKDMKSSFDGSLPSYLTKKPINKSWSDSKISWNSLPSTVHDLGKEAVSRRNVAFCSAVHALEEASASDGVIRCMSMFGELCESSRKDGTGAVVEQFLNLHSSMEKAAADIDSLLSLRFAEDKSSANCRSHSALKQPHGEFTSKNSRSWVRAGVEAALSNFSLFTNNEKMGGMHNECYYVVLEETSNKESWGKMPQNKQSKRNNGVITIDSSGKGSPSNSRHHQSALRKINIKRDEWSKGSGLKEASYLAHKMLLVSRAWFLTYLEDSLGNGFKLRRGETSTESARVLGQLKRVNKWLSDLVVEENGVVERIERLKKLLYDFLLEHVDSAVVSSR